MTNKPNWQSELRDRMLEAADLGGDIYCVKAVDIATAFIQDLLDRRVKKIAELKKPIVVKYGQRVLNARAYNDALDKALNILKEEK